MKKKINININGEIVEKEVNYIPFRFILAIFIILIEFFAVLAIMTLLTIFIPYFYILVLLTQLVVAICIVNSKDNPDYKVPWLFFVMLVPIIGFMSYFMFYSRELTKKQRKKIEYISIDTNINKEDVREILACEKQNIYAVKQAKQLCKISNSHLYQNTDIKYFSIGEEYFASLLKDIKVAKNFIFLEYFIIEEGYFWNTLLDELKNKAKDGVEVRVVYDDIGCMNKLPSRYYKDLQEFGIKAIPFAILRGQANNEFNNRSHRKIAVIDGKIGYTGGVNIADEYINKTSKFGHWKDVGIRLEGEAVNELTRLFLIDYDYSVRKVTKENKKYYIDYKVENEGFCIPFGDGPKPIFENRVAKIIILNFLNQAHDYVYITSPYLIIDNELLSAIENASIRGIDVRIITPHIPDKKAVFMITRSNYERLTNAGVKIFEYAPGFIHSKMYISDDKFAMIGTVNMDYRSLVHHFENGVWIYNHEVINSIKCDFLQTQEKSLDYSHEVIHYGLFKRFFIALLKIISPLL